MHINSQWLVTSDHNVDPQVEFMPIDQQWVRNILWNYGGVVYVDVVDVVNDVDTFTLAGVGRLNDPDILLGLMLLQLLVVIIEVTELFREDVSVRG